MGQFDRILHELIARNVLNLRIVPGVDVIIFSNSHGSDIEPLLMESYELYWHWGKRWAVRPQTIDGRLFREISDFGIQNFADVPIRAAQNIDALIIDRGGTARGHGATTRRIPNVEALATTLSDEGYRTELATLENSRLVSQVSMFKNARCIIAQHGSALCNLVWCAPGTHVIELVPKKFNHDQWRYFELLAACMDLDYHPIVQADPFDPVDVDEIAEIVNDSF